VTNAILTTHAPPMFFALRTIRPQIGRRPPLVTYGAGHTDFSLSSPVPFPSHPPISFSPPSRALDRTRGKHSACSWRRLSPVVNILVVPFPAPSTDGLPAHTCTIVLDILLVRPVFSRCRRVSATSISCIDQCKLGRHAIGRDFPTVSVLCVFFFFFGFSFRQHL